MTFQEAYEVMQVGGVVAVANQRTLQFYKVSNSLFGRDTGFFSIKDGNRSEAKSVYSFSIVQIEANWEQIDAL